MTLKLPTLYIDKLKQLIKKNPNWFIIASGLFLCLMGYWLFYARFIESTDNAYVGGNITPLSPKVDGYISQIYYDDGAYVSPNTVILKIDDQEYKENLNKAKIALLESEATLKKTNFQYESQKLKLLIATNSIETKNADFEQVKKSFERSNNLWKKKFVAQENLEVAKSNFIKVDKEYNNAKLQLNVDQLQLQQIAVEKLIAEQNVNKCWADLKIARLKLSYTLIKTPTAGIIGQRSCQVGQYVLPGTVLGYLVPLDNLWVIANFKETQISKMKAGQTASVKIDAFSSSTFEGIVESISPASGAEFSLLPPDNSTGNFTKVVQRIPIKILLKNPSKIRVVPGMSVEVTINTHS